MVAISHNPFLNRHPFRDGEGAVSVVLGKLLREPVICGSVRQQIPVFGFVFQCGGEVGKSWGRSWPVIYIEETELPPAWHERQWPRVLQDEPEGAEEPRRPTLPHYVHDLRFADYATDRKRGRAGIFFQQTAQG